VFSVFGLTRQLSGIDRIKAIGRRSDGLLERTGQTRGQTIGRPMAGFGFADEENARRHRQLAGEQALGARMDDIPGDDKRCEIS